MEITGKQSIPSSREVVWDALNNPEILKKCLPGCESVERTTSEEFRVVVVTVIGPLRARFNGVLRITEALPPVSCVMVFEGQGGAMGFGKGSSSVTLDETPEGTELSYCANAQVGGKLAQVGSRLIDSVAKKMSDDFFKAFRRQLAPEAESAPVVASIAPAANEVIPNMSETIAFGAALPQKQISVPVMVPGWWLAVAVLLGSAVTLAGSLLVR